MSLGLSPSYVTYVPTNSQASGLFFFRHQALSPRGGRVCTWVGAPVGISTCKAGDDLSTFLSMGQSLWIHIRVDILYGSVWIISRRFYTILYLVRVQAGSSVLRWDPKSRGDCNLNLLFHGVFDMQNYSTNGGTCQFPMSTLGFTGHSCHAFSVRGRIKGVGFCSYYLQWHAHLRL